MEKYQYTAILFCWMEKMLYFCTENRNIMVFWPWMCRMYDCFYKLFV